MSVFVALTKFSSSMVSAAAGARCYSQIGFVGLGNMGSHMAKNLLTKGYKLTVYDVNKSATTSLVEAGASVASSAADLSKEVEVVISMLPSNQHVLDVYTGQKGILSAAKENVLLIDSSTVDPSVSQSIAAKARRLNLRFIDSPVSGELYSSFRLGLDARLLADIINSSSGRCWSSDLYNPVPGILPNVPSSKNYEGGFGTTLMAKDLGLVQSAATRTQTPIPLGSLAHQIYRIIIDQGFSNKDFSVVYQFLKGKS
ncbi:3-hydroxyisobutyrate dehydrogenase, mitochondrial-like [Odontomachus brunneus]|uniref:3-hydroxyisobutyrate dehydrogenase, mitochondrial-like n=1 Tax=Odontomachus brunneus TaxID=486640 RepID=UPI0013F22504|nr:3-hydroxyisobutyrate dehydrogenase, mitochondrial-like [Odontomachus brunneus]